VGERALSLLFVGQDAQTATLIRERLREELGEGASLLHYATSAGEALARYKQNHYDLLLVDEYLRPESKTMNELISLGPNMPVVMLSEHADEATCLAALRAGATDCVSKSSLNEWEIARLLRCSLCRRKQKRQSREAEDHLRRLSRAVEQSGDLVVITDRTGKIEYVNPAFEELTGYAPGEAIGQTPRILKSGKQDAAFYKNMWSTILAGNVFRGVLVNRRKDGELFHAEKTIAPVRDSSGRITHFISNDRNITERRKLEAQLLQAQKMDAIGQLAGGVAHDFNNLLMVISSYAELALDSLTSEHPLHRNFDEILKASHRAADLTRQLLAFSRKQMQSLQALDLNHVLRDLARMLPRLIGEDIELELHYGPDLGRVQADPVQIEQVIMNLAANARDAMPQGGKLTVATANIHVDEAYVHQRPLVPLGHYVLLTVTDSGRGISPEHLPHIFEPFFTTKDEGKGTGLGLATVYGIVKQSNGFIWVYSEPGMGTTFKIYLPQVGARCDQNPPTERLLDPSKGNETLLLVEDEEAVRVPECEFLRQCGYRVLEARDGRHALEVARAYQDEIHLMITDVVMPFMSGGEAATALCRERDTLKVLYVSGYANPTVLQHGVSNAETSLLQKPFTLRRLAQRVREVLG
jgi:two-component system cell cycle sensor histidine kinase/response regulator CckA